MKVFVRTFGCQQNVADSERIMSYYMARGYEVTYSDKNADLVVINSCMIRDKAEERVYGYIRNLRKSHTPRELRIVLTGCIIGAATREPSGKMKKKLEQRIPDIELLSPDEVGFEYAPIRNEYHVSEKDTQSKQKHGWVILSNGCNNYCAFCIVPFSRGREISRPYDDILREVKEMANNGYSSITLLGQNVNSYGSDLVRQKTYTLPDGRTVEPVMVKHLSRQRIPTLFPHLLEDIAQIPGIETVTFTSSNPWDFSDELIDVIKNNHTIDRLLHLPVQSGSTKILKAMNRWYSKEEYIGLIERIRQKIPNAQFITDIIVGFPGETLEDFEETVDLVKKVGFVRAFIACYSPRPGTYATAHLKDDIPLEEKKRRMKILNEITNLAHPGVSEGKDWIRTKKENNASSRLKTTELKREKKI